MGGYWTFEPGVEYGGYQEIDKVAPRFREASNEAVALLVELGYYVKGKGFQKPTK